jgi:hypothetical protein
VIGRSPHFTVEATTHALNLFTVLVGATSKGRKGTALDHIRRVFNSVDQSWTFGTNAKQCVSSEAAADVTGILKYAPGQLTLSLTFFDGKKVEFFCDLNK